MGKDRKTLLLCAAIPLAVGALSAFLTRSGMETFKTLNKPPLSPPGWLFPVVWTVLFLLMGAASYLVWRTGKPAAGRALTLYAVQLGVNFVWPLLFFNLGLYLPAFFWLAALWLLIVSTIISFFRLDRTAGYLLVPYLLWVTFAGYLNLGIYFLN